jgi:hypothetical protein
MEPNLPLNFEHELLLGQSAFLAIYKERVRVLERKHTRQKEAHHAIYIAMLERQKHEMASVRGQYQLWRDAGKRRVEAKRIGRTRPAAVTIPQVPSPSRQPER